MAVDGTGGYRRVDITKFGFGSGLELTEIADTGGLEPTEIARIWLRSRDSNPEPCG
jgi:hypothetical protein